MISQADAIREASRYVDMHGAGTSWTVYGPYRSADPEGPYTESRYPTYEQARASRTAWRARVALALMDRLDEGSTWEVDRLMHYESYGPHDLRSVVSAAAKQYRADRQS